MKILRLTLVGALLVSSMGLFAQEETKTKTPEERAEKMTTKMVEKFELDEAKAKELKTVNLEFANALATLKGDKSITKEEKKKKFETAVSDRDESYKEIFSEEQMATIKEMEAEKMAKRLERKENKHADLKKGKTLQERVDHKTEILTEELSLSETQKERVAILNLKVAEKIKVIKQDSTMSKEKKKEFIQGNIKDYENTMKSILDEEQFKKFEALKEKKKADKKAKKAELKESILKEDE